MLNQSRKALQKQRDDLAVELLHYIGDFLAMARPCQHDTGAHIDHWIMMRTKAKLEELRHYNQEYNKHSQDQDSSTDNQ